MAEEDFSSSPSSEPLGQDSPRDQSPCIYERCHDRSNPIPIYDVNNDRGSSCISIVSFMVAEHGDAIIQNQLGEENEKHNNEEHN